MKTYHGSCHCGAVRYEARIDLAQGTIKCNCSICTKMRFWAAVVPPSRFRLLAGADAVTEYRFHRKRDGHCFCRHCGINVWSTGDAPGTGRSTRSRSRAWTTCRSTTSSPPRSATSTGATTTG